MPSSPLTRRPSSEPVTAGAAPRRGGLSTQEMLAERRGPGLGTTILRTLLGVVLVLVVLAIVFFAASAIEGDDPSPLAPWSSSSAPSVAPAPLADQ